MTIDAAVRFPIAVQCGAARRPLCVFLCFWFLGCGRSCSNAVVQAIFRQSLWHPRSRGRAYRLEGYEELLEVVGGGDRRAEWLEVRKSMRLPKRQNVVDLSMFPKMEHAESLRTPYTGTNGTLSQNARFYHSMHYRSVCYHHTESPVCHPCQ